MNPYTVKNVRNYHIQNYITDDCNYRYYTNEPAFSCSLYRNGIRIAFIETDRETGLVKWNWFKDNEDKILNVYIKLLTPRNYNVQGEGRREHVSFDNNLFIGVLVQDYMRRRKLRKLIRHGVLYCVNGVLLYRKADLIQDNEGNYIYNLVRTLEYVRTQQPSAEILNEKNIDELYNNLLPDMEG